MSDTNQDNTSAKLKMPEIFENLKGQDGDPEIFVLHLYVAGTRPNSRRAIENIQQLCEEFLPGRFELKIIDIYQQPALAKEGQIFALPTLIKLLPSPQQKFIGDMSDKEKILQNLGVC